MVPFFFQLPRPFDGPFAKLNVPFSEGTLPFWKPGQNTALIGGEFFLNTLYNIRAV